MIVDSLGNVGIGTSAFDATKPEKLLVDAGTSPYNGNYTGTTPILATGFSNGYQEILVQNRAYGANSSSDLVAMSDGTRGGTVAAGTDNHYVDLGINSSGYSTNNSNILNQLNTPYLYATAPQHFFIGNGYSGKDIVFFTNYGTTNSNNTADGYEVMRITGGTNSRNRLRSEPLRQMAPINSLLMVEHTWEVPLPFSTLFCLQLIITALIL